jgi:hypothetical protein
MNEDMAFNYSIRSVSTTSIGIGKKKLIPFMFSLSWLDQHNKSKEAGHFPLGTFPLYTPAHVFGE